MWHNVLNMYTVAICSIKDVFKNILKKTNPIVKLMCTFKMLPLICSETPY